MAAVLRCFELVMARDKVFDLCSLKMGSGYLKTYFLPIQKEILYTFFCDFDENNTDFRLGLLVSILNVSLICMSTNEIVICR